MHAWTKYYSTYRRYQCGRSIKQGAPASYRFSRTLTVSYERMMYHNTLRLWAQWHKRYNQIASKNWRRKRQQNYCSIVLWTEHNEWEDWEHTDILWKCSACEIIEWEIENQIRGQKFIVFGFAYTDTERVISQKFCAWKFDIVHLYTQSFQTSLLYSCEP